eukprot:SAG11_NODE_35078_length_268_cov_1.124260_1_plen_46_part_00
MPGTEVNLAVVDAVDPVPENSVYEPSGPELKVPVSPNFVEKTIVF